MRKEDKEKDLEFDGEFPSKLDSTSSENENDSQSAGIVDPKIRAHRIQVCKQWKLVSEPVDEEYFENCDGAFPKKFLAKCKKHPNRKHLLSKKRFADKLDCIGHIYLLLYGLNGSNEEEKFIL